MNLPFLRSTATIILAFLPVAAISKELKAPKPLPPTGGPTTIYRQITPEGRIVYSDKLLKGTKLDRTMIIEAPPKRSMRAAESGTRSGMSPQVERMPVIKVPIVLELQKCKTAEEAEVDVVRAGMLLDEARKRRDAGEEPLPGERTGNADGKTSRLNDAYWARQQELARDVKEAEARLKRAVAERDALLKTH